ncbi:MAG: M14 family metallopeptidase [Lacunisphaera sp.]|nr:M14 family metallopeptidase [Lacunisphaera sp.]
MLFFSAFAAGPQDFLPPAPPWHGASEVLLAPAGHPWITPAEKTGLTDSPGYDETVAWLKKLCAATPLVTMEEFGRTAQGRPLYAVLARRGGAGKPVLLAQAGIHSGEIDGKDAGLMLLRDIAFGGKAALLDHADFLFVPVFNADGHERASAWNRPNQRGPVHQGWRTTAQNLNLNRDYLKADSPEMQAMLALINRWQPALYLDLHVTDGVDYQYDITFGYNGSAGQFAWSPRVGAWLEASFEPMVSAALTQQGHIPGPLVFATNNRDLNAGIGAGVAGPRFSQGYGDLRHIAAVLVENHSLKSYKQRVLGTYVLLEAALQSLAAHGAELRAAIAADSAARPAQLPVNWSQAGAPTTTIDFKGIAYEEYLSPASGTKEVRWLGTPMLYPKLKVQLARSTLSLARPRAYYVPVTRPDLIARLRLHGLAVEALTEGKTARVDLARLVGPKSASAPYEGRHPVSFERLEWIPADEYYPAGSVRVPTDQPLGDLAMMMLEPACSDSLLAQGFFPEILQRTEYIEGYVVAPLAEKMLAADPALKAEFEAKLAADPKFAADPTARLQWFYARSPFYDSRYLLYPVGIER